MGYYQTFINAVRATGGNNATRTLIIQGLQTDIDKSVEFAPTSIFPKDNVSGHLMFEVHFYGPYQYVLMTSSQNWNCPNGDIQVQYYYGDYQKPSDPKHNAGYNCWANSIDKDQASIGFPNAQFAKMKSNYVDKGYPVIIGEFGSLYRSPELSGSDLELHRKGRIQWHKDVVTAAKNYGLTPILWDMGNEGASYDNMAYIRRQTNKFGGPMGKVVEPEIINAMRGVYGLGNYVNKGVTHTERLIPGSTPIQNSSSSVTSSSSVQPIVSSSSMQPAQSSSSSSVNPWQPQSSSSNNQPSCDALIPECGYTHEALCSMGFTEYCMPVVPVNSSSSFDPGMGVNELQVAKVTLNRQGNMLVAQGTHASISLFDMNGNLVRQVNAISSKATMNLAGIQSGFYIAKSGAQTLKVNIR